MRNIATPQKIQMRKLMPKKTRDGEPRLTGTAGGERTPPPLGEDFIAKLQGAVEAARRKRMSSSESLNDNGGDSSPNHGSVRDGGEPAAKSRQD